MVELLFWLFMGLLALRGLWNLRVAWIRFSRPGPLWREVPFSIERPFPLRGTPDLVWREADRSLTIHDLKIRRTPRAYPSDVLQLSLYRLLVAKATGKKVNPVGFVRSRSGGPETEVLIPVQLLEEDELVRIRTRYDELETGRAAPKLCPNKAYCAQCGFKGRGCPGR